VYTQALLAVYARLCKDVPVPEYTTQLLKELALWKLCGIVATALPPVALSETQSLTAAGIVAAAWGKMTGLATLHCGHSVGWERGGAARTGG
jgi:hypothetical protein